MRFLADENIPGSLLRALTANGHDVASTSGEHGGATDPLVLGRAIDEGRVLLTFDKDFGELAQGMAFGAGFGVILLRIPTDRAAELILSVAQIIFERSDWPGCFSVITPDRLRMRPLAG